MNSNAAEYFNHPKYLINAAVNLTTLQGTPAGSWNPQEKLALRPTLKPTQSTVQKRPLKATYAVPSKRVSSQT